jgi:hypothetical protein
LHHATADLLLDEKRVHHPAAILDDPMLQERDEAGLDIDLQPRGLDAIGEGEGIIARHVVPRRHELGLDARRQRVAAEIGGAPEFVEADAARAIAGIDDPAVANVERSRRRLAANTSSSARARK